ncbi:putative LysR family transcriptional regulator [Desulfosarcina cetonica]|uniref:LysR substrate-binding domain-containing protein n=1 Tax=Desulfosarcina cetonica TaxID=90730 RepID=UPI0006CF36A6|nr:LysR substrate-binding domain-containing protein [Desulfosarcina cetonica]VTR66222.1 putative LysR family transcriptional regulator [Desulfosarcina cetonica]
MNLNQLKALDALAQAGTFAGAAKHLGLTQPAVSIQLRRLQEHHGVKLFWRNGGQLEFSRLGESLVVKARTILGLLDDFEKTLASAGSLTSGNLAIGLSCHYFVMDLLAVFMERYPGIQVKARIGDSANLIADVLAGRLDLAEVTGEAPDPRLFNLNYSDQSIVLFVDRRHPWAKVPFIAAEALDAQAMVARHPSSMTRQIFQKRLKDRGIALRVVLELDAWEAMKAAVAAGIGFGIALADEFVPDERLVGIPVKGIDLLAKQYFVCLPAFERLQPVQAFFSVVRSVRQLRADRPSHSIRQTPPERLNDPAPFFRHTAERSVCIEPMIKENTPCESPT